MTLRFTLLLLIGLMIPLTASAKETKEVVFTLKSGDTVVFNHDIHLSKYNNNCKVCHNAIFNLKARRHFTMAEMEKTKSCGACHSGVKAFSVATEKDCVRCHKSTPRPITYKPKGAAKAVFSHEFHLAETDGKCRSCHGKIITGKEKAVSMADMEKGKTCGACHNDKRAFTVAGNCGKCHKGFKPGVITFKNEGGEVKFSHEFHLNMFKCADCHTKLFPFKAGAKKVGMTGMEGGKSCGACHNGKEAFTVKENCDKCHKM